MRRPSDATLVRATLLIASLGLAPNCGDDVGSGEQPAVHTVRMSERGDGTEGNAHADRPWLSADGRFVAFESDATTFSDNDYNGFTDIFVRDRTSGMIDNATLLPPPTSLGPFPQDATAPHLSSNGRWLVFESTGNFLQNVHTPTTRIIWRLDRLNGTFKSLQQILFDWPDRDCTEPSVSDDGRYVAFRSDATNLVASVTPTVNDRQIFVADFTANVVRLASRGATATTPADDQCFGPPRISGDGDRVVFHSNATNLSASAAGAQDVFVWSWTSGTVQLVSRDLSGNPIVGTCTHGSISGDGRYVAFYAFGDVGTGDPGFGGVLRRDLAGNTTEVVADDAGLIFAALEATDECSISADGRYIAYISGGTGVGLQVKVRDMQGGSILASVNLGGQSSNFNCTTPVVSGDGRWVAWCTQANNLVHPDLNGLRDIFVHGPLR